MSFPAGIFRTPIRSSDGFGHPESGISGPARNPQISRTAARTEKSRPPLCISGACFSKGESGAFRLSDAVQRLLHRGRRFMFNPACFDKFRACENMRAVELGKVLRRIDPANRGGTVGIVQLDGVFFRDAAKRFQSFLWGCFPSSGVSACFICSASTASFCDAHRQPWSRAMYSCCLGFPSSI